MVVLESKELSKTFGASYAVKDADLTLETGHIYGLLGPNGSGKTTFMKMAAGLFYPTGGSVEIMGMPVGTQTKKHVAFMSTEQFFYRHMTVEMVGRFYSDFFEDFDFERYRQLVNFMELDMKMKIPSLSTGMAAKLRVAATMARNARLYMLDEPLNGIDMIAQDQIIRAIIETSAEDNVILISSHLISMLENILDTVIMIKKGKIVLRETVEEIREKWGKSIADVYREVFGNV